MFSTKKFLAKSLKIKIAIEVKFNEKKTRTTHTKNIEPIGSISNWSKSKERENKEKVIS